MRNKRWPTDSASFRKAKATFDLRYYRWAQQQARREIEEDFPTLRLIKNELVYRFFEIARPMSKEEQSQLLSALLKRSHPDGVELAGEAITGRDEKLIDRYVNHDRYEILPGLQALDASFERRGDKRIYRSLSERAVLPKIDKKYLRKLVVKKLQPILGESFETESAGSWRYEVKVGPWSVCTIFATYKKFAHLSYFHRIRIQEGITLHPAFGLSPMQWLGIGGSSADWTLWENSEIEEATDSLCVLVKIFLDAAPLLLEGMSLPDLNN